ncbi:NeuD/PglB/VioB family sugar acetyltransferase [Tenacibaculum jejuense]|uniref:Transferase hexapeptide repeat containing protein n=1 Tax=Tenacibaculum jejuense TaxID=584609 RepID=A0A238U710_9FLAO|nr:NeuD/PglB/VioB family sugar acetyltransferase [Tenacibaculum jejuense]SNR14892.1 Transferase hexapeptide repeat containing protein [Tenacibaculum jejuense]
MRKPDIVLIGGGGHCMSVIDVIENENKYNIKGILDSDKETKEVLGYPVLGTDDLITDLVKERVSFLITIGQIKSYSVREKISQKLIKARAKLATVVSPRAHISRYSTIGKGTVIMHDVIINAGAKVGDHCIINTKVNIEHGVEVENFCHISTCAVVNGDSKVEYGTFVGSNATISNGIVVEKNSIISAGKFIK